MKKALSFLLLLVFPTLATGKDRPPNIVYIMSDELAYYPFF